MKQKTHSPLYQQRYKIMWLFFKYQLLIKLILAFIIIPLYQSIIHFLITASGKIGISSGDYIPFLFSFNGIGMLIVTVILMILLIGFDINTFILTCSLIHSEQRIISVREMIRIGVKSLNRFGNWTGLLMMLYVTLILPLLGIGIAISPMKNFQIPNFIMSVIENNGTYFSIYILFLISFTYLCYRYIFSFHYLLIENYDPKNALKQSALLIKQNRKTFIWQIFLWAIKFFGATILIIFSTIALIVIIMEYFTVPNSISVDFLSLLVFITVSEFSIIISLFTLPMLLFKITDLFYQFTQSHSTLFLTKNKFSFKHLFVKALKLILLTVIVILFNFGISYIISENMNLEVLNHSIQIVAHRGGGDFGAENTLEGIQKAIEHQVDWTEIDVQRTKDHHYILNHDQDFKRLTGDNRTSTEMTLEEIKQLKVKNLFDTSKKSQPVATIEEVIAVAKNKIGLFIELKGKTADTKMVDDMVDLIKANHIEKEAVLVSLDYKIIEYIETQYPEILSGYIYFFSIGSAHLLKGDFLIIEEAEATPDKVDFLRNSGKKVIVWTVNTDESIEKFAISSVDGIITDYVTKVRNGIDHLKKEPDVSLFFRYILNWMQ